MDIDNDIEKFVFQILVIIIISTTITTRQSVATTRIELNGNLIC